MSKKMKPKEITKTFQWNTGGWFGAQIGSTFWLLLLGLGAVAQSFNMFALLIICFLIPNLIGTGLWMNRARIAPYTAIQILLFVLCAATSLALLGADYLGYLYILDQRIQNPRNMYWILMIFPTLMIILNYINRKRSN